MTADEIRSWQEGAISSETGCLEVFAGQNNLRVVVETEIAAQLAELNANLSRIRDVLLLMLILAGGLLAFLSATIALLG